MDRRLSSISVAFILPQLLAIFIGACAPPRMIVEVTERPEPSENIIVETPLTSDPADVTSDPFAGVEVGRFDGGKMWTFDNPPVDYFEDTYDFRPDSSWFARAMLGALRFSTYCSASFVSPSGLILTNHHCARSSVTDVTHAGENLLDNGFYADSLSAERRVADLYVEQLLRIQDVTAEVYGAAENVLGAGPKAEARRKRADAIKSRLESMAQAEDSTMKVEVIALYHGGIYSAYTFKRYNDIRLVMAPELQIGFFGGDFDNFTFPRFNLDMSLFRAYGEDGEPLNTPDYFRWNTEGSSVGEAVFVVGNPGSTSRLSTVSQLEYYRDYSLPQSIKVLEDRSAILERYLSRHREESERFDIRNDYFSLLNELKSKKGQLGGLQSGEIIKRRGASDAILMHSIGQSDSLSAEYSSVLDDIARLQISKRASAARARAFTHFLNPTMSSHILTRAMYGYVYTLLRQRGAPADQLKDIRDQALKIKDWPEDLERDYIAKRLSELVEYLGSSDPTSRRLMGSGGLEQLADSIAATSVLADSAQFISVLDENYLTSGDITVEVIGAIAPLYFTLDQQLRDFMDREETYSSRLARARFAVVGGIMPPDASFSLRIADGIVSGYAYNGTIAPAFTTYYGLYDQTFSHSGREEWTLPERWNNPAAEFDLSTPLNLVSTNDITGGNSGSPLLNRDLEIVGLVFDSNMEALPNEYLFRSESGRTISVDARGIIEALDDIYGADRIVIEILTGTLHRSEREADQAGSSR